MSPNPRRVPGAFDARVARRSPACPRSSHDRRRSAGGSGQWLPSQDDQDPGPPANPLTAYRHRHPCGGTSTNRNELEHGVLGKSDRASFGLELETPAGGTVYGWADFSLSLDGQTMTVHGWADDTTGGSILAGQTESSAPVPGIGGLAVLAFDAGGLRRQRSRVA